MKNQFLFVITSLVAIVSSTNFATSDDLTRQGFEKLHAELTTRQETWKTIPWHADLLSAQRQAVKEKKLIFIWAMDGHPLGCT